jgi:nitrogen fixation/metabolism regulation signal transduction histidine kinase
MKDDLRKELASKKELDEVDVRMGNIEEDFDNMTISLDVQIKKTKENSDEIESKSF